MITIYSIIQFIILLNLVISIIGSVFEDVHTHRIEIATKQRAAIIADAWTTFFWTRKNPKAKHQFLFFATEESSETAMHKVQKRGIHSVKEDQAVKIDSIFEDMHAMKASFDQQRTEKSTTGSRQTSNLSNILQKLNPRRAFGSDMRARQMETKLVERKDEMSETIKKMQQMKESMEQKM